MRKIVSTESGFAIIENGKVVSEHNRDDELDNLLQILQNNKDIQETIDEACRKPINVDIYIRDEDIVRVTKAEH